MDLNRIRYFSVLVEQQHVRKAAEVLGINPASLSKAIKLLGHEVGFPLTMPSGRGIVITDRGLDLYRKSRGLLNEFNAFQLAVRQDISFPKEPIRLGSMEVFTTYFLSKLFEKEQIEQSLRVHYLTPKNIESSVKLREIDLGITYIRLPDVSLDYLKIGSFRMELFGHKRMREEKVEALPFAVPIDGVDTPSISLRSLDGWPNEEFPRRIKYEFELLETALQFARTGRAVVYCPDFVGRFHNESLPAERHLCSIPLPTGFKSKRLPIYLVRRKNELETPFVRQLAKLARSLG